MWKWITAISLFFIIYSHCARFRADNRYTCHCKNNEQCNRNTGECRRGCASGWSGRSCQKQNVALGKNSNQVEVQGNRSSDLAVDGDKTVNETEKCSDTSGGNTTRWWMVDLEQDYPINNITIYYRNKPNWVLPSLKGFSVHVNKEKQEQELCFEDDPPILRSALNHIQCNKTIDGRYVNISNFHSRENARFLTLCEVEIYVCSVGTYGSDCTKFCHCLNNERCSETGECPSGCADGWRGTTCSQFCDSGMYGAGCSKICSRRNCLVETSLCNHIDGSCEGGCKSGFSDIDCVKACDSGMYGAGCSKLCSERNCLVETSKCNHINGSCDGGCKGGFRDIDCVKGDQRLYQ